MAVCLSETVVRKVEFDELPSLNVDIVRAMVANGRFSKGAFEGVYRALPVVDKYGHEQAIRRMQALILKRLPF